MELRQSFSAIIGGILVDPVVTLLNAIGDIIEAMMITHFTRLSFFTDTKID
jgi:hypothetical protein